MNSRGFLFLTFCLAGAISGCKRSERNPDVLHRDGDPDVIYVDSEDAEMNAAIAHAQSTKAEFLQTLQAAKPNQTDFSAKRPYLTNKGGTDREHIWVSNLSYDGKLLHGTIGDDPVNIPHLKLGDPVSFPPDELSDWMYLEDGKIVGGYTIRVLRKRMSPQDATDFDQNMQFKQ
ncbi:MAG: DUF2314 domain-containing protein [Chthoniobacteraceae bacterium]